MGDLSPHFSGWEFDCHHGGEGHQCPLLFLSPRAGFIEMMESVRAAVRAAGRLPRSGLRVVSGKRCDWWNRQVRGARNSQHKDYGAADIEPGRLRPDEAKSAGVRGIGIDRNGWVVHVDNRPGRRATWRYR